MSLKDHYQVLQISPAASAEEIKKAFRALALRYHPDKNRDPAAAYRFAEIQDAWYVLRDKQRRSAYNYQRYLANPQTAVKVAAVSPEDVLRLSTALYNKALASDPFRTDMELRYFEIKGILSNHNLSVLTGAHNPELNASIIEQLKLAAAPLGLAAIVEIVTQLQKLDPLQQHQLDTFVREATWKHYWNRSKIWVALAVAVLFCVALLLINRY